jgi:DNA-binding MarR family transcriptional regulator
MTKTNAMTHQQRRALAVLRERGQPISVDELAEQLGCPRTGAAATASSLIRRGLVERTFTYVGGSRHVMYEAT